MSNFQLIFRLTSADIRWKLCSIKLLKQKYAKHCFDCEWTLIYFHCIVVKCNVHVLGYIFLTNSHSLLFWGTLLCKICSKADDSIAGMLVTNVGVLFFFKCPIMSPISHRSGWSFTHWGQIVYQIACLKNGVLILANIRLVFSFHTRIFMREQLLSSAHTKKVKKTKTDT